jgi:phosphatidylglycerophosphate synthase
MAIFAHIIGDSPVKLWGLTSRQRKMRVLKAGGVTEIVDDIDAVPENSSVLLFRGDYLFDDRVINYMVKIPDILLRFADEQTDVIVAAHVASKQACAARDTIAENVISTPLAGVKTETMETLSVSFQQRLLKFEPPFVLPITSENKQVLERRLFDWSYKGVTDLVTKWAWPRPAQWVVGQCVRFGLRPNHVTIVGLLLVILAGALFAYGFYGWGLLAGWLMTFLDTVDGKLARVTVTSSKFGHYFDHIIDLIHPPVWYILWGLGLGVSQLAFFSLSLNTVFWLIVVGYTVGRLVEGAFLAWLGKFGIFTWRPIDSYFRLITARRNPNLLLLTLSTIMGRPDLGLLAVAFWTVLTTAFLIIRLAQAGYVRLSQGPLSSWFMDVNKSLYDGSLAVRLFTRRTA